MITAEHPVTFNAVTFTTEQLDVITWAMYAVASALADELDTDDITIGFCQPVSLAAAYIDLYRALGIDPPTMMTTAIDDVQALSQAA